MIPGALVGLAIAVQAVAFAWGRWSVAGAVVSIELRKGDDDNWRWFGLDSRCNTVCSGFPHHYITLPMARDVARACFPTLPIRTERPSS